jgi:hypothetical protein
MEQIAGGRPGWVVLFYTISVSQSPKWLLQRSEFKLCTLLACCIYYRLDVKLFFVGGIYDMQKHL